MADLSKLGIGLTLVFLISLLALLAELCYIFFRRRRAAQSSAASGETYSKVLGYLLFWRSKSKIEPSEAPIDVDSVAEEDSGEQKDDELVKWQQMYGPSRVLFTIVEEEREDLESERDCDSCHDQNQNVQNVNVVVMDVESEENETPFYTPVGSPSLSPSPEVERGGGGVAKFRESEGYFIVEMEELRRGSSRKCCPAKKEVS